MLCAICQTVKVLRYFQDEVDVHMGSNFMVRPREDAFHLGSLKQIYDKGTACSFCRLIIASIRCTWGMGDTWQSPEEFLHWGTETGAEWEVGKTCYIYSYLFASNDGSVYKTDAPQITPPVCPRTYRIGIGVRRPQDPIMPLWDLAGHIQLSSLSATERGMHSLFHGRLLDFAKIDLSLVRSWLRSCEFQHCQKCELPALDLENASPDPFPDDLMVIDVQDMCLYRLPPGNRYVALSYCWPENKAQVFLTTLSNVVELLQPGSFRKHQSRFSLIIQDAINCVRELGERFLWVDALCIIQDDELKKYAQIRQMDRVYGSAFLTIICAPPESSDMIKIGLPGCRPNTRLDRQHSEEVQGITLVATNPAVDLAILHSRWDQRAWTFQEHRLSKRKLFITRFQLYFQCSSAVFCEDTAGEDANPTAFIYAGS